MRHRSALLNGVAFLVVVLGGICLGGCLALGGRIRVVRGLSHSRLGKLVRR